eukprot:TRINITY_DN14820_c0_g1_i1.p1 TRINITY_DN14820_c0_g1~~TRINITY_DN14820_c0_g1_i1.p1  ORF type:complete len:91 (+),score=26.72 TRINITY_DN14820_c0_g1_i1:274-546(+)
MLGVFKRVFENSGKTHNANEIKPILQQAPGSLELLNEMGFILQNEKFYLPDSANRAAIQATAARFYALNPDQAPPDGPPTSFEKIDESKK